MPDDLAASLRERLDPAGLYGFAMGLYVIGQSERLGLTAGISSGSR